MKIDKNIAISEAGLVFNPLTGESFSANPLAAEIIGMIKDGSDKDAIISFITGNYNVEASACEKDLQDFYDMLRHYQIIADEGKKA